jgi:hypothetical protein
MSGLAVQVRTRSKVLDYRFVGAGEPPERWWEKNYGRWTDFSRPTILVEPGKFFVSGIGSARTDSKGARIHYAIHARIEPEGRALAAQVLAWLCEVRQRTKSLDEAGAYLDSLGDDVWSAAVQGEAGTIDAAVMGLLRDSPRQPEAGRAPQRFLFPADDPEAFACLAGVAAEVLAPERGGLERAVYLNLASSSELQPLLRQERSVIVCREVDTRPKSLRPLLAGAAVVVLGLILATAFLFNATS